MSKTFTRKNNYDKSSTGTDIEFRGFMDIDASRREFEENIKIIQHDGYSTTSIGYYIENGNVDGPDAVKFKIKGKKADKIKYLVFNSTLAPSDIRSFKVDELDAEIRALEEDVNLINYALDKLPNITGLEFIPNKNLIVLTTRGYSQGDYAKVLYCPEDLEKAWGNAPKQEDIQTSVDHYYWDCPVYAVMEVNKEEFNFWDSPHDDSYLWDKEKFIAYVSEKSGVDKEKLNPFVPEDLDYL